MKMPQFFDHNNRWRAVAFPVLYLAAAAFLATPRQLCDIAFTSAGALLVTVSIAFAVEIGYPSQVDHARPSYGYAGRIGFGAVHAIAWTALALAGAKFLLLMLSLLSRGSVCPR